MDRMLRGKVYGGPKVTVRGFTGRATEMLCQKGAMSIGASG